MSDLSYALPTRLVVGLPPTALNIFGELVELEERFGGSSPGRDIPVTASMRDKDARLLRERSKQAIVGWALKPELRAEKLAGVKVAPARPGRIAPPLGQAYVAVPRTKPVKATPLPSGRPREARPCRWCGEMIVGYYARRAHQVSCPVGDEQCAAGCGRPIRRGKRQRTDGLCHRCSRGVAVRDREKAGKQ